MALNWYLNGINLKDYGITVSGSNGIVDGLQMKSPFKVDLPGYHGEIVDLEKNKYEPRDITLICWIKASGMLDFTTKVNTFNQILRKSGTHRFMIEIDPDKPLVYEVYFPDKTVIDKKWSDSTMVGTFSLKMRESLPIKKVFKYKGIEPNNRNLLRDTDFEAIHDYSWTSRTDNHAIEIDPENKYNNRNSLKITAKTTPTSLSDDIWGKTTEYIVKGGNNTIAFWVKGSKIGTLYFRSGFTNRSQTIPVTTDWKYHSIRIDTSTSSQVNSNHALFSLSFAGSVWINSPMLIEGDSNIAWNQAPEDIQADVSLTISSDMLLNIYWGDESFDFDINGNNQQVTHHFQDGYSRYVIVSGNIEEIKSIKATNLTEIWNIL